MSAAPIPDSHAPSVLITDYAWPNLSLEHQLFAEAGIRLHALEPATASPEIVRKHVLKHQVQSILTCWANVDAASMAASSVLHHVGRIGVGLDNIDVAYATSHGIQVTNVPAYCLEEVSDHAVALALNWTRGIRTFDAQVRMGRWEPASARLRRISALQCGIIGFGRIGQLTARKLSAGFCAQVQACDPNMRENHPHARAVSLEHLLQTSDIVIVHAPLTTQTHHLIDTERLALMRQDALLINVSRGGLVDTQALVKALDEGRIGGAALDVLEEEPYVEPALLQASDVTLTPHVAFTSDVALEELRRTACEEAIRAVRAQPLHYPCNHPAAKKP